jgi:crotonobetainyl-CoA:carnitine CoA-transferase CaiB-like acyl-CoA transferase
MTVQQGDTEGWGDYTIQAGSQAIFEQLVNDPRLNLPEEIKGLASTIEFVGEEKRPFFPVPYKCAEAQAGLLGYIGLLANAISRDRYQVEQRVEVDV